MESEEEVAHASATDRVENVIQKKTGLLSHEVLFEGLPTEVAFCSYLRYKVQICNGVNRYSLYFMKGLDDKGAGTNLENEGYQKRESDKPPQQIELETSTQR